MKNIFLILLLIVPSACTIFGEMDGIAPPINANFEILGKDSASLLNYQNFPKLQISFEDNGKEVFLDDLKPFVSIRGNVSFKSNNMIALYAKPPKKDFTIWLEGKKLGILEIFSYPTIPFYAPTKVVFGGKEVMIQYNDNKNGFVVVSLNPEMYFTLIID